MKLYNELTNEDIDFLTELADIRRFKLLNNKKNSKIFKNLLRQIDRLIELGALPF